MSYELKKRLEKISKLPEAGAISDEWKKQNRELLLMQVKNTCKKVECEPQITTNNQWKHGFAWFSRQFQTNSSFMSMARPVMVFALIVALPLTSWVSTVNASLLAVPGDKLYGVKIMTEKVQLSLTSDKKEEIALRSEFAVRRADEVNKLKSKSTTHTDDETKGHIKETIKRLENEIKIVNTDLDELAEDESPTDVMAVAKTIDAKSEAINEALKDTHDLDDEIPGLDNVKSLVDETVVKAVEKAVAKNKENHMQDTEKEAVDEEIKSTIQAKLKVTAEEIEAVLTSLEADNDPAHASSTPLTTENNEIRKEVQEKVTQAKETIEEAVKAVDDKAYQEALTTIKSAKTIVSDAKKAVAKLEKTEQAEEDAGLPQTDDPQQDENASSTDALADEQVPAKKDAESEGSIEADSIQPAGNTHDEPETQKPSEGTFSADFMNIDEIQILLEKVVDDN